MNKELLYATNNQGKVFEVARQLQYNGIKVVTPKDLGVNMDVEETGQTLEENATLKVDAYRAKLPNYLILTDDTGIEIDSLNGEPGIHVRRWKDRKTRMSDQEIIDYCIDRMKGIPTSKRGAKTRTVLALGLADGSVEIYDGVLSGTILEHPAPLSIEGFPFESLFFIDEWSILLGDLHRLPVEKKQHMLNHRERALEKVIPRIREILSGESE